ncbi:MAG: serine hydrolase domain-containing protein [Bauldia sp.]
MTNAGLADTAAHPMPRFEAAARAALRDSAIPGVVAVVADRDCVLYEAAFGELGAPGAAGLRLDDVFCLASMTKPVTCFAALQLIERGKLSLDDLAGDHAPGMLPHRVLTGFAAEGTPAFRDPVRPVTIRHLMTHTSGYATDAWNADILRYTIDRNLPGMTTGKREALHQPLVADPGTRWEHSIGVDWLGRIVETVSEQRLEEYFAEHIFAPLGMTATGFILGAERRARLVPVWAKSPSGAFEPADFAIAQEPEFYMGGAGLYGTAGDYIRFLRMLLNRGNGNGRQLVRPETADRFLANHTGDIAVRALPSQLPAVSADIDLLPDVPKRWSLAAMTNIADVEGRRRAGSQFWAGLASTYFWLDPASGLAGVALFSCFPFVDPANLAVFEALERDAYARFGEASGVPGFLRRTAATRICCGVAPSFRDSVVVMCCCEQKPQATAISASGAPEPTSIASARLTRRSTMKL